MSTFPGFLTADWFAPHNAGLLRYHIRARLHRLMAEQAPPGAPAAALEALQRSVREFESRSAE